MLEEFAGYQVNLSEFAKTGPRLIVLLHGFGASIFSWRTVTGTLSELGHVVAYDRHGFGSTPVVDRDKIREVERVKIRDAYSLAEQVSILKSIIHTKANGRPVVLIGHSAGALVVTEFILRNPGVATAVILESPAIWRRPPIGGLLGSALRIKALEPFGVRLLEGFAKAGMKILRDSFYDANKLTQDIIDGYTEPMSRPEWKLALWRFMTASQKNEVRKNLWRIDVPTMVITGDHDKIVKVEDTFKVAERIDGHSIYLVPNTGHLAHEEDPKDFLRVVTRFIEKHS